MKHLNPPTDDVTEILESCASEMTRRTNLAARLRSASATIVSEAINYEQNGEQASIYTIPASTLINGVDAKADMEATYEVFRRDDTANRVVYDRIRNSPPHKICPMCNPRCGNGMLALIW
jgi:hypothetical protein